MCSLFSRNTSCQWSFFMSLHCELYSEPTSETRHRTASQCLQTCKTRTIRPSHRKTPTEKKNNKIQKENRIGKVNILLISCCCHSYWNVIYFLMLVMSLLSHLLIRTDCSVRMLFSPHTCLTICFVCTTIKKKKNHGFLQMCESTADFYYTLWYLSGWGVV